MFSAAVTHISGDELVLEVAEAQAAPSVLAPRIKVPGCSEAHSHVDSTRY